MKRFATNFTRKWVPAHLVFADLLRASWLLFAFALIRGLDYMTGGESTKDSPSLNYIEGFMPIHLLGTFMFVFSITLGLGLFFRKHAAVWAGHIFLGMFYSVISLGSTISLFHPEVHTWLDGARGVGPLIFIAFVHCTLAQRMGPVPLDLSKPDIHIEETTVKP